MTVVSSSREQLERDICASLENIESDSVWLPMDIVHRFAVCCEARDKDAISACARLVSDRLWRRFSEFPPLQLPASKDDLISDFARLLGENIAGLPVFMCTRVQVQTWSCNKWAGSRIVNTLSLPAMVHCCAVDADMSMHAMWQNEVQRLRFIRRVLMEYRTQPLRAETLRVAAKRFHKLPSGFQCVLMKTMIDRMLVQSDADAPVHVLDPCAGWGNRLVGFWASQRGTVYVGTDPNPLLVEPHRNILEFLRDQRNTKTAHLLPIGAESETFVNAVLACLPDGRKMFHLVFTCPPYYNVEHYVDDAAQSDVKFVTYDAWRQGFLLQMIRNAKLVLCKFGILALVVKNCVASPNLVAYTLSAALSAGFHHANTITLCCATREDEILLIFRKND